MKEHWSRRRVDFERRQPQQLGRLLSFIDLWFTQLLTFLTFHGTKMIFRIISCCFGCRAPSSHVKTKALHPHKEAVTLRSEVGWQLPNAMWMGPSSVKQKQEPLVLY